MAGHYVTADGGTKETGEFSLVPHHPSDSSDRVSCWFVVDPLADSLLGFQVIQILPHQDGWAGL